MKKVSEELLESLGRLPGESQAAFKALVDYAMMEPRSLRKLVERYAKRKSAPTKRYATITRWSTSYNWQHRVAQYDLLLADQQVELWLKRREELNELDWEHGMWIRDDAMLRLKRMGLNDDKDRVICLKWLVENLVEASKLQRLATNEPTSIVDLRGNALDAALRAELERIGNPSKASIGEGTAEDADTSYDTTPGEDQLATTT